MAAASLKTEMTPSSHVFPDRGVRCHGMKANPTGNLWSKSERFLISGYQDMFRDVLDFDLWPTPWHGPLGQISWN